MADEKDKPKLISINNNGDDPDVIINNNHDNDKDKKSKKKRLMDIDFDSIFKSEADDRPSQVVVLRTGDHRRRPAAERRRKEAEDAGGDGGGCSSSSGGGVDDFSLKSDLELRALIEKNSRHIETIGPKLPDRGAKLKVAKERAEEELERRKNRPAPQDDLGCNKLTNSAGTSRNGEFDGPDQVVQPLQPSQFAVRLLNKLKPDQNTGDQPRNGFDHEISYLNQCDKQKRKSCGRLPQSKRAKPALCSKDFSAWKPRSDKYKPLDEILVSRASLTASLPLSKEKLAGSFTKKDASDALKMDDSKNEKTVVLVDEEEAEFVERKSETKELPLRANAKIYYPTREDPESLEIFRLELRCLEPGECLTSTIMNFYIRFLQESSIERSQNNFHFFNTYFYSKLQKAVTHQNSDKEAFFLKFRRWWRGVNIFHKAYIFLPINEDNHWSLVIICIPDKDDETGPLILHLDSLGLHSSKSIFDNIKSLLKNEWDFIREDGGPDIPFSDRIWRNFPRRIEEKIITVPRQTNDYDCGLFVLYYMERFIEEAPDRLKREHLAKFSKNWFKPQEASRLRGKIRKILQEFFLKAATEDDSMFQPVCLSARAEATKEVNHVNIS